MRLLDDIRAAHDRALADPDALDLGDDRVLVFKEPDPLTLKFEPFEAPTHDWLCPTPSYGTGVFRPTPFKILPARHGDVLHRDGWTRENLVAVLSQTDRRVGWHRHASGDFLTLERAESGRYDSRPPTNRKRKRARCKSRRRARKPSRLPAWLRKTRAYLDASGQQRDALALAFRSRVR